MEERQTCLTLPEPPGFTVRVHVHVDPHIYKDLRGNYHDIHTIMDIQGYTPTGEWVSLWRELTPEFKERVALCYKSQEKPETGRMIIVRLHKPMTTSLMAG